MPHLFTNYYYYYLVNGFAAFLGTDLHTTLSSMTILFWK
jgi:hypothetical protein